MKGKQPRTERRERLQSPLTGKRNLLLVFAPEPSKLPPESSECKSDASAPFTIKIKANTYPFQNNRGAYLT